MFGLLRGSGGRAPQSHETIRGLGRVPHLPEPGVLGEKPQPPETRGLGKEPPALKEIFLQK